jgi:hypothetical protein
MGKKDAPDAPDYTGAAVEEAEAGKEIVRQQTWANRPEQITPWGSTSWSTKSRVDPSTNKAVTQWHQTEALNPQIQRALDSQIAVQQGRSGLAQNLIGRAAGETAQQFDWNNMPDPASAPDVPDFYGQGLTQMGSLPNPNPAQQALPEGAQQYNELNSWQQGPQAQGLGQENIQRGLNYADLNDVNAAGAYNPDFAQTQYDRNMSLLRPEQERAMESMEVQLRNRGLTPGTEAYDRGIRDLRNQQSEARGRISADSVRYGGQEQQNQFQREMARRGQQAGEINQQGQFANQAAQQALQQQLGIGAQRFGQQAQAAQQANALRGQQFGEMQALQQQQGSAQDAAFNRQMQTANYQDQQRNQLMKEQLAMGGQGFNQQMQAANYQNTLRQQAIAEEAQRRGMSINEMNALMTGQQVGTPQMPQFMGAGAAQAPQLLAAAQAQGNFDQQGYSTGAGMFNAFMGAAGAGMKASDRRLKHDIQRRGTSPSGIPTYTFRYSDDDTGQVYSGAMAQDLLAMGLGHAVAEGINGMLGVFYDLIDVECVPVRRGV